MVVLEIIGAAIILALIALGLKTYLSQPETKRRGK